MSAGLCGKRAGFDDIFGSPTSSQAPSAKRSRCCSPFGSPTRCSDLGFGYGSDDKLSLLLRMFPSVDRKVVESILDSHDQKIDDAIKHLHALCINNDCATSESISSNPGVLANQDTTEGGTIQDGSSSLLDTFVLEMMNASDWEDVRGRTAKLLEAFERSIVANSMTSKEQEIAALKEQLQCLLKDNHILKKGVQIQHDRTVEQEEKLTEIPQLKHFVSQCQEQIRKLEMDNYTLRIHLQRAHESNSMPNHFHRDIF